MGGFSPFVATMKVSPGGFVRVDGTLLWGNGHMSDVSAQVVAKGGSGRRFSLRGLLTTLVLLCVLPAMVVSSGLTYSIFRLKQANVEQQAAVLASAVMGDVERELSAIESALKVLATARELQDGDLKGFHRRATDALAQSPVTNYILTNPQGGQVLNTLVPHGKRLPRSGTPQQLGAVFSQRQSVLTDVFMGPVVGRHVIALGVPVQVRGEVVYSLNVGLSPQRISDIIARHALEAGWLVAVLDQSGTIVGRSREPERFVGQPAVAELAEAVRAHQRGFLETTTKEGVAVFSAYTTSALWRWHVVVGAPTAQVHSALMRYLWWLVGGVGTALLLGLWLAHRLSMRVLSSVRDLNNAALALGQGEPVVLPHVQLREAEAVGQAMLQASDAMQRIRFLAQHDTLTELPNRRLLAEGVNRQLALAVRKQQQLALLAVDLDGFKAVNDTLGHAVGDGVLQAAAQRILQTIRASDMAARVGGDEFLVMLADVTPAAAMETAQRLVAALGVAYGGVDLPVSASVGVALFPTHGADLAALAAQADAALYEAKHRGKGRAVMATG